MNISKQGQSIKLTVYTISILLPLIMKLSFRPLRALSAGVAASLLAGSLCLAQAQEAPVLSPGAAEVLKLVQAGVGPGVIKTYIGNISGPFNLNAATILYLNDAGVSTELVDTMMDHDKNLAAPPPVATPAPAPVESAADAPVAEVTVDDFTQTLAPYGAWVDVEGYGRCWRPTVAVYDSTWQPYGDRGHWVYTDAGWYWDSEYAWGVAFHYGRWFHHANFGWCWWPDTVWAPSWVTWRSADDYCGWAPLPPFSVYRPGLGFYYRGVSVAAGFDFGLDAGLFMFVPVGHFCEPHPRYFRVDRDRGAEIFHRAAVVNSFEVDRQGNRFVNRGIPVERINNATHRTIAPVRVEQVPHADRQEWHGAAGGGFNPAGHAVGPVTRPGGNNNENHGGQNFSPGQRHEVTPANNNGGVHGSTGFNPGQSGTYQHPATFSGGFGSRPEQPAQPRTPGIPPGNVTAHEATTPANHNGNLGHGMSGNSGQGQTGGYQRPEAPVQPRTQNNNNNYSGWTQSRPVAPTQPVEPPHNYVPAAPAPPAQNYSQPRSAPASPSPGSGNQSRGGNISHGSDKDKGGH